MLDFANNVNSSVKIEKVDDIDRINGNANTESLISMCQMCKRSPEPGEHTGCRYSENREVISKFVNIKILRKKKKSIICSYRTTVCIGHAVDVA